MTKHAQLESRILQSVSFSPMIDFYSVNVDIVDGDGSENFSPRTETVN